jgi:hypothetical protein
MKICEILIERSPRPAHKGWTADASAGHSPFYDIYGDGPNKVDPTVKKTSSNYKAQTKTKFDGGGYTEYKRDPVSKKTTKTKVPGISAKITRTVEKPKGTEWKDRKTNTKFTGTL